jgi:hypothetical protein
MSKLHIVTVATHNDGYLDYLIESCKKNNNDIKILGYGEKWQGFNWRFLLVINYLKTLNLNDIVCFVDGYDVLCTRNLDELSNEFIRIKNKYDCKIIVGHDKLIVDNHKLIQYANNFFVKRYFDTCKKKSLNAGTYIGYVSDLLIVLQDIYNLIPSNSADDQILFTKYCKTHNKDVHIDVESELFLAIAIPYIDANNYIKIKDNKVIYNNSQPFFVHAPGGTYLDKLIINLGYNYKPTNQSTKPLLLKKIFEIMNNEYFNIILIIIIINIIYYIYIQNYLIFKIKF